jgi:hypothetical protein
VGAGGRLDVMCAGMSDLRAVEGVATEVEMGSGNVSEESILREDKLSAQKVDEGGGMRRMDEGVVTTSAV